MITVNDRLRAIARTWLKEQGGPQEKDEALYELLMNAFEMGSLSTQVQSQKECDAPTFCPWQKRLADKERG